MRAISSRIPSAAGAFPLRGAAIALFVVASVLAGGTAARADEAPAGILPLDEFSPGFLGMYRKVMLIENEIRQYAEQYGVDFDLARAICLYESGGNAGLTSVAGAQGYFQVMPATFRELGVTSNIEAGVKYLAQMIRQFDREDRAVAAYNGGPGRVGRSGGLPLETLQYVLGVSHYRTVLKLYEPSLRHHASRMNLAAAQVGDDWASLSRRLEVPDWELRVHNAFLAERRLRPGQLIAYPSESRQDLFRPADDHVEYRVRHGDNYIKLAFTLGVDLEALRTANGLWQLQSVPAGVTLRIPLAADRTQVLHGALRLTPPPETAPPALANQADDDVAAVRLALAITPPASPTAQRSAAPVTAAAAPAARAVAHRVVRGDTLAGVAARYGTTMRAIQDANGMGNRTTIRLGEALRIAGAAASTPAARAAAPASQRVTHRVARGDTLAGLARRYGTSMSAIQQANGMGSRTTVRLGDTLRIPAAGGAARASAPAAPRQVTHRVARGETLSQLAERYRTTMSAIQQANGMGRRTGIRVGETLRIPAGATAPATE